MMIVLFIVLSQKQTSYTFGGYYSLGERCDKISGRCPSCGLTTEPPLSEPLWALLPDASRVRASSPVLQRKQEKGNLYNVGPAVRPCLFPPAQVFLRWLTFCLLWARPFPPPLYTFCVQGVVCDLAVGHIPGP